MRIRNAGAPPLPVEVREALMKLKTPCESDRELGYVCDEEATHMTMPGVFLCTPHANEHNFRIRGYRWGVKEAKYLANPIRLT